MSDVITEGGRWRDATAVPWRPTAALARSTGVAATLFGIAVVVGRPDLLVLGAPFAIITAWSAVTRPAGQPVATHRTGNPIIREGDATRWRVRLDEVDHVDTVSVAVPDEPWLETQPPSGAAVVDGSDSDDASVEVAIAIRSMRWGRRILPPIEVLATSPWGAFRTAATTSHTALVTLPDTPQFDVGAPARPTRGLVGLDRSARRGDGSEYAGLRAFTPGDRMRRINWMRSTRTDELQVNATWADHDLHVELVVDATADYGPSGGLEGVSSSLDTTVRAVAAIAQHYVHRGDRVSLRAFGATQTHHVRVGAGWKQQRRILETLSALRAPGRANVGRRAADIQPWPVGDAGLTVMLSPLISRVALDRAVQLGRRGIPVVVIDTLPDDLDFEHDPQAELAWRLRRLERRREIRLVERAGIPVVHWAGPGSLDQFLRDVARRATAPRMRAS
jgi:uncharacterized protein (DUF58 family)